MSFSLSFNYDNATKTISCQGKFKMNDVQYVIKFSSDKVEEQGRQVVTLMKNTDGVNMVRKETMMEDPEFSLTGEGLMENASEEELKNFVIEWMRLIHVEEVEEALTESMYEIERFKVQGGSEFLDIVGHFFPDFQNLCKFNSQSRN